MWPNPQLPPDLVTFTEEILNGKLNFFPVTLDEGRPYLYLNVFYTFDSIYLLCPSCKDMLKSQLEETQEKRFKHVVTYESRVLSSWYPLILNRSSHIYCLVFVLYKKNYFEQITVCSLDSNFEKDGYFYCSILLAIGVLGVPVTRKWEWETPITILWSGIMASTKAVRMKLSR